MGGGEVVPPQHDAVSVAVGVGEAVVPHAVAPAAYMVANEPAETNLELGTDGVGGGKCFCCLQCVVLKQFR